MPNSIFHEVKQWQKSEYNYECIKKTDISASKACKKTPIMFFSKNENWMVMCTWKAVHAIVTQVADPGSQLLFSNIRTVSKFHEKGLIVVPFHPANFCLQIQSTFLSTGLEQCVMVWWVNVSVSQSQIINAGQLQ